MLRKGAMVLPGTVVLAAGSGVAAQDAEIEKARQTCEAKGGWFDPVALTCDDSA
jgi:hypothetical protein